MTAPPEAFTIAPIRVAAPSEARKAASRAVSATVEGSLRSAACSIADTTCSFDIPSVLAAFSSVCWRFWSPGHLVLRCLTEVRRRNEQKQQDENGLKRL